VVRGAGANSNLHDEESESDSSNSALSKYVVPNISTYARVYAPTKFSIRAIRRYFNTSEGYGGVVIIRSLDPNFARRGCTGDRPGFDV
jgi:hypothetical protein